jgi:hypothetical protein
MLEYGNIHTDYPEESQTAYNRVFTQALRSLRSLRDTAFGGVVNTRDVMRNCF